MEEENEEGSVSGPDFGFSELPSDMKKSSGKELKIKKPVGKDEFIWPFPPLNDQLQVGDVVVPKQGFFLRSGCSSYEDAIVVSVNPFVLVSRGADMRWSSTVKPEHFQATGKATNKQLRVCMTRLTSD